MLTTEGENLAVEKTGVWSTFRNIPQNIMNKLGILINMEAI